MSDLTQLQATEVTRLTGSDSSGNETNPINSSANGEILSADVLNATVVQTTLSVTSSTIVAARVGGANLVTRKTIMIQALTSGLAYGFSATSTPFLLPNGSTFSMSLGANTTLYVGKTGAGAGSVAVVELS